MKATGIVRRVDDLGRVVLPIELRRCMAIGHKDPLEIFVDDGNRIVLRKYQPACVFCGSCSDMQGFKSLQVCGSCRRQLGTPDLRSLVLVHEQPHGPV